MEDLENILKLVGDGGFLSVIVALIAGLFGRSAWDFYKKKITLDQAEREAIRKDARAEKESEQKEKDELREELKDRISSLEEKLTTALREKEGLLKQVYDLKTKLVRIETKLEILLSGGTIPYDEEKTDPGIKRGGRTRKNA